MDEKLLRRMQAISGILIGIAYFLPWASIISPFGSVEFRGLYVDYAWILLVLAILHLLLQFARAHRDLNQFSSPSTVHDHGFGHLLAWLLLRGNLGTCAVGFGLLDFKLHVTVLPQWSAFSGVPSGGNLHQLGFGFERLRHMGVDLGPETLWVSTRVLAHVGKKQLVISGTFPTIAARTCCGNEGFVLLVERGRRQL